MSDGGEFLWRPVEPGDVASWAALLVDIQQADHGWEYLSEQDLREEFDDPDCDYARGSIGVFDGDAMAGYGVLTCRTSADPVHDMRYWGGVHPAWRGRGLGGRLLDWAQQAAVPLHRERYPGRPLTLSGWCLSENTAAVALYAGRGFRPSRWFNAMVRDLSAALPDVPAPRGVDIVGFTPERSQDGRLIRNEAFRDHWGSTETSEQGWAHFIEVSAFRPAFSFLAYAEGEPAGLVLGHQYDAFDQATGVSDLYIPLVATRREYRNRGIASALLFLAMARARAAGFGSASLGVDADSPTGAVRLYQQAGFTIEHTSVSQAKPLLP